MFYFPEIEVWSKPFCVLFFLFLFKFKTFSFDELAFIAHRPGLLLTR